MVAPTCVHLINKTVKKKRQSPEARERIRQLLHNDNFARMKKRQQPYTDVPIHALYGEGARIAPRRRFRIMRS